MDSDRNGRVNIFELFSSFVLMDSNSDGKVTPEELVEFLRENESIVCRPYRGIIDLWLSDL
jgi:Ca2+-binding EF-hand superfamily protein